MNEKILEVNNLQTHFFLDKGVVKAVDGVSFSINKGETLGIVGESGSGKSVTSASIMQLIPNPPGKIVGGEIIFKGEDLLKKPMKEIRKIRGNEISMIFQEPMTSLNPVYTVGDQIAEAIQLHQGLDKKEALAKAVEMLEKVGIPSPEKRVYDHPHQMSGGMRQRVMIAMALACNPDLLIADEPTTALDVTIQAQILELMKELRDEFNTAIMLITHDLGVIAEVADKVAVMYGGRVVEYTDVKRLFKDPEHPYTAGLIKSIPRVDGGSTRLTPIEGNVPDPFNFPQGCKFANRCPFVTEKCWSEEPQLEEIKDGHLVRCHRWEELDLKAESK
ncbi:peptide ABC transporter ATP-binding protein [Orenia metallireducens]|uniref:Peptide ABC transporter ATP-binding protein n=1 Tax=Orenia metallireducens TaxID=1413210 RepID=A0A1C0AB11_9FIRM|nr:ABC transporter ATP-binding protein [Orenia metallireducens]OCL27558.1 peptide ABC transporter ATP-binding protein [Orenia metallireducens]OCL27562.1 peptide ABC transporter ATP-binding protein [Orenia metallireducens]